MTLSRAHFGCSKCLFISSSFFFSIALTLSRRGNHSIRLVGLGRQCVQMAEGSVMSRTSKATSVRPLSTAAPQEASNPAAPAVVPVPRASSDCSSLTASQPSNISVGKPSRHSTTVTSMLRKQIEEVEAQLMNERRDREAASRRIRETQQQLDALEQLLKLKP